MNAARVHIEGAKLAAGGSLPQLDRGVTLVAVGSRDHAAVGGDDHGAHPANMACLQDDFRTRLREGRAGNERERAERDGASRRKASWQECESLPQGFRAFAAASSLEW